MQQMHGNPDHRSRCRRLRNPAGALISLLLAALAGWTGCAPDAPVGARRLLEAGHREQAARAVEGYRPATPEEWELLARIYSGLYGFEDEAVEAFTPLGEEGDPEGVLLAAEVASAADRPGLGIRWLESSLERHPGEKKLAMELARLLSRQYRYGDAAAVLAPLAGNDPVLLNLTGFALLHTGDQEKAREYLEKALHEARLTGRDFSTPHHLLGLMHSSNGDDEQALEEHLRAVAVHPDYLDAHYQAIVTAERLKREDVAVRARREFARIYGPRLRQAGSYEDVNAIPQSGDIFRGVSWESRESIDQTAFVRSFRAGSSIHFACLAPAGQSARFEVTVPGPLGRTYTFDHGGGPDEALWHPHRIDLPGGQTDLEVEFRIRNAGTLARLFRGDPPEGAAFSIPSRSPSRPGLSDDRLNILFILLDTLRADRVGSYGYPRNTTPSIDLLAGAGVRFEQPESASNWTLPSHYSLFSGMTPAAHGVMPDMGGVRGYLHPDRRTAVRGSGREVMLAEVLAEAGYRTAAVTESGWVSAHFGFDQGFDMYRSAPVGSLPGTLRATTLELEEYSDREPWFLFVHTYAPHQPYHAPLEFRTRWASPNHSGFAWPAARVPIDDYKQFGTDLFPASGSDVAAFRDLYDGQVAWSDTLVEELISWLGSHEILERTLIVIASDHGEELFERGQFDHGDTLYEEVTRVPLILHAPRRVPAGKIVRGPVSMIDLPATILDVAGIQDTLGQGRSLRPLWEEPAARSKRAAFAEAIGNRSEPLYAVWHDRYKFIRRQAGGGTVDTCFDIAADPSEIRPLSGTTPCDRTGLPAMLDEHLAGCSVIREGLGPVEGELDRDDLERLRGLGYIR